MRKESSQSDKAVFEMILDSMADQEEAVAAKASRMTVPENWHAAHKEGQLSVDILETESHIIAVSTMAGASTSHLEIFIHSDLLTIRGKRLFPLDEDVIRQYLHEECFWGPFSRTVVLPIDVDGAGARASYKNGILTILIPKRYMHASPVPILVVED